MNSNKTGYPLNFNFRNLCYAVRSIRQIERGENGKAKNKEGKTHKTKECS
jgi:hypothetical protein